MKRMASGGARLSRLRHSFQMGIPREKWGSMGMQWGRTGCHGNQTYQNYGVVAYGLCCTKKDWKPAQRSAREHCPHWERWFFLWENVFGAGASWEKWAALCLLFHTDNLEFWFRMIWHDMEWLKTLGSHIPRKSHMPGSYSEVSWNGGSPSRHGLQYGGFLKWGCP